MVAVIGAIVIAAAICAALGVRGLQALFGLLVAAVCLPICAACVLLLWPQYHAQIVLFGAAVAVLTVVNLARRRSG